MTTLSDRLPPDRTQRWAIGSAYTAVFFSPVSISVAQASQLVMLAVAALFLYRNRGPLLRSPLPWLALFFLVYVILRGFWAAHLEMPDIAHAHWAGAREWVSAAIIPMVVFGLVLAATGDWLRHSAGLLIAWLLGFVVYLAINVSPGDFFQALQGQGRYFFEMGFRGVTLTFPAIIVGLVIFVPFLLARSASTSGKLRVQLLAGIFLLCVVLAFATAALIAIQGRAAWINTALVLLLLGVMAAWVYRKEMVFSKRTLLATAMMVVLVPAVVLVASWDTVSKRWQSPGVQSVSMLVGGDLDSLESDSATVRVAYWKFGIDAVLERPLTGYGLASPGSVRDYHGGWGAFDSDAPSLIRERGDNLHNSHIGVLFRMGLLGYVPIAIVILIALNEARLNLQSPGLPRALALFVVVFTALLGLWAMYEDFFSKFRITQLYGPIIGTMLASHFARKLRIEITTGENREHG